MRKATEKLEYVQRGLNGNHETQYGHVDYYSIVAVNNDFCRAAAKRHTGQLHSERMREACRAERLKDSSA